MCAHWHVICDSRTPDYDFRCFYQCEIILSHISMFVFMHTYCRILHILVLVLFFSTLYPSCSFNHLDGEERVCYFTLIVFLMSCVC